MHKKLVVILGPTGSGKTKIAEQLTQEFNGEIINADSRQIYIGMDIGTNKSPAHLIDIINPGQEFTVAQYKKLALACIKEIHARSKLPFLVGGTGLYIQAIVDNLKIPKIKPNQVLRKKLEKQSCEQLLSSLKILDPITTENIDKKNKRRLIRALEVCLSGQKFSQKTKSAKLFDILQIGISAPKEKLYQKINKRVNNMIEQGLEHEVKLLGKNIPETIGYQEFTQETNLAKIANLIKLHTRQYAKRQMTWFKRDPRIAWISSCAEARKLVNNFLNFPS
ncbi:MAG: tRNA (adenosine(37)-N6)-dimethylallyltransferase MiaA [bacterium]